MFAAQHRNKLRCCRTIMQHIAIGGVERFKHEGACQLRTSWLASVYM